MTEKLHQLIIEWQAAALACHRGPRTKENLSKAKVFTNCAQQLLDTLAVGADDRNLFEITP